MIRCRPISVFRGKLANFGAATSRWSSALAARAAFYRARSAPPLIWACCSLDYVNILTVIPEDPRVGRAPHTNVAATAGECGDIDLHSEAGRTQPGTSFALLFVARVEVREHYLIGLFDDNIREDRDLPYLDLA